ncbi:transcriptional regulator [Proteobacteria bacterium 005FR1]|nr:transcriptional regulator [Proteobacteria bacterium 005FR1]
MSMRRTFFTSLVFSLGFALPAGFAVAQTDTAEQVNRVLREMSTAVRELNYRGLFTYEVGGSLDTYRIVHRVENETEYERLQKLNGPEREIIRAGHMTDCLSQGDQLLRGIVRSAENSSELKDNYHFYLTGDERVADRSASIVHIVPKDSHRFGYTLSIDKQSGLPLKAMRVNTDKRVMERIQFVELTIGGEISESDVEPSSAQPRQAPHNLIDCQPQATGEPAWKATWLPPGFVYSGQRAIENGDHMQTYTDGLATFSVFVSAANTRPAIEGRAQIGATVAYVDQRFWKDQPHSVTVVGEIPFATAQRVVAGVEPR